MTLTRRAWLKTAAITGGAISVTGCEQIITRVSTEFGQAIPDRVSTAGGPEIDPVFH